VSNDVDSDELSRGRRKKRKKCEATGKGEQGAGGKRWNSSAFSFTARPDPMDFRCSVVPVIAGSSLTIRKTFRWLPPKAPYVLPRRFSPMLSLPDRVWVHESMSQTSQAIALTASCENR